MKADTERKRYHKEKLHKRKKRLHIHLSKELRGKLKAKKRAILVRKGDTVKVMRGGYKGHVGKVSDVDTKKRIIFIEKVTSVKADGKEAPRPIHPSNVLITKLDLSDPWRKKRLEERTK